MTVLKTANIRDDRQTKYFSSPIKAYEKIVGGQKIFVVKSFFTSDNKDEVGDIITKTATEKAIEKYRQWGNIRLMHQPKPVGKILKIGAKDGLQWNECEVKVVDEETQKLIKEGVLSAMSVGIIINEAEPITDEEEDEDGIFGFFFFGPMKILDYDLVEISYVDHPANYDARITDHPGMVSVQSGQRAFVYKAMPAKDIGNLIPEDLEGTEEKGSSEVQTLLFDKEKFTEAEAKKWASDHDFKSNKVDVTENKIRLRQFDPDECDDDTYGTKEMADGVQAVYCVKKSKSLATPPPETTGEFMKKEKEATPAIQESLPETLAVEPVQEPAPESIPVKEPEIKAETPEDKKEMDDGLSMKIDNCMGKMDELMSKMDTMMESMSSEMSKEPETEKAAPATEPVQPKEIAPEVTPTPDLSAEKTLEAMEKMLNLVIALDKKQDGLKETVMAEVKEYIETLRTPASGKASLTPTTPVEKKDRDAELKNLKPKELEAETRKVINQLFESLRQPQE